MYFSKALSQVHPFVLGSLTLVIVLFGFSRVTFAFGTQANDMCNPVVVDSCGCHKEMGSHGCVGSANMNLCPCSDTTSGFVTAGICVAQKKCLAQTTNGGGLTDPSKLLEALQQLMQALKGGGGGGGGGGSQPPTDTGTTAGCTTYHQVSTPSSDPCAIYVPNVSSTLLGSTSNNISNDLLNALTGTNLTNSPVSSGTNTNTNSNSNTNKNSNNAQATASVTSSGTTHASSSLLYVSPIVGLAPGIAGDIQVAGNGATVIVTNQNAQGNSITAGFYGSDVTSGQPQSLVSSWCQSQPWNKNFLSGIIPPSFFDSLCLLRGFKVGLPVIVPTLSSPSISTQKTTKPATTTVATSTGPYVPPQADIWAVPATVPLAARTTIFWSTKGVTSCTETSPDGSFSQNSLSGGAATVPLSGATTFTISCIAPDGTHVTNYVTVGLTI